MKHFLLTAAMLLSFALCSKAQVAKNSTDCDVIVTVYCYDKSCNLTSTTVVPVPRGTSRTLPRCTPDYAVYEVCWAPGFACIPALACTMVDGIPSAPSPCGIGTTSSTIQSCDYCNNGGNGIGYVDFIPGSPDLLDIHK